MMDSWHLPTRHNSKIFDGIIYSLQERLNLGLLNLTGSGRDLCDAEKSLRLLEAGAQNVKIVPRTTNNGCRPVML